MTTVRDIQKIILVPFALFVSCKGAPPEPEATASPSAGTTQKAVPPIAAQKASEPASPAGDPLGGKFTLADATKGLAGTGPLVAKLETSKGKLECKLFEDKAPETVANFVGLARGIRPWKDSKTGAWVSRPLYDGTTFHRVIPSFMIQGGDPLGNGTGEPGYVFKDEIWPGAKHDRAGLLCMANRGAGTNGSQFFITDDATPHLDAIGHTIFGECTPVETVHEIAKVQRDPRDKPLTPVVLKTVTITREKK